MSMARELIDMADENDSFLKKIVTGDETSCFLNNPYTKRHSSKWTTERPPRKENFHLNKRRGEKRQSNGKICQKNELQECFEQLYELWNIYANAGQYFE
ncbi:hypothetical protein TNCV_2893311 [Trichonephila clavipes]|nr:hypothetical protein TNCV_2893311 [Trichonephila clavipes]